MTTENAIKLVEHYNNWRREEDFPSKLVMPNPTQLGIALEILIKVAKDSTTS